ncbi:MAG: hypothetical protein ABI668_05570 [Sphingorhabdus sp.]
MPSLDLDDLAYCEIDGTLIFLDIEADRYFCLSDDRNREALAAIDLSTSGSWHQPASFPRPSPWTPPTRACAAIHSVRKDDLLPRSQSALGFVAS